MSKPDPKKKRARAERVRQKQLAEAELARKKAKARKEMPTILQQLHVLFQEKAATAISMAFEQKLTSSEISAQLNVPVEQVEYLFDTAATISDDILRIVKRWPNACENPRVLKAALEAVESGKFKDILRSQGLA